MSIAVADEHVELAHVVASFLADHDARKAARAALDGDADRPPFWNEIGELGWLGLHIPEELGGSGYGLIEVAVVAEQLARHCTPGPFLPTVVVSAALAAAGTSDQQHRHLPGLTSGATVAGLGVRGDLSVTDGALRGDAGPVLCGASADVLALVVGDDLVLVPGGTPGLAVEQRESLDPTRPSAAVRCDSVALAGLDSIAGGAAVARHAIAVLAAAEAAGGAAACRDMAAEYARERCAFGRPIGQFQAIKHLCADIYIDEQLAAAAAWEAARRGATPGPLGAAAALVALPAFLRCSQRNIQVHGGIGFTWEHDAHLYYRRAVALAAVVKPAAADRAAVAELGLERPGGELVVDLPAEADAYRAEARQFLAEYEALPEGARHSFVVESGYLFPHWPAPWGRDADAVEQLVIDEELRSVNRLAALGPTGWTLPINIPTIITHGTDEQRARWIGPTMAGRLTWCQLLSEPGAGSDLAALATRAERVDGGWRVTGQKVWTSSAQDASVGFALVRTGERDSRHAGITCMVIDMTAPGVTIRPLRQITGDAEFNEVFLDEVFVPDADVVGDVNEGWRVARTSLQNERVSLGEGSWAPPRARRALKELSQRAAAHDPVVQHELADLVATTMAIDALSSRAAAAAVAGRDVGGGGSVTKLVRAEHAQRLADFGRRVLADGAAYMDGDSAALAKLVLHTRAATIAGGTSEIVRNLIAERILDLPRERAR